MSSHLVTKSYHAILVAFHLGQVQSDIPVELIEELNPITNQDRQD